MYHNPYYSGFNPSSYPPQQPNPNYKMEMDNLWQKMKDMESKIYSTPQQSMTASQQPQQKSPNQLILIPVTSADEAFSHAVDYTGAKQYFINESKNEIYVRWFDANLPKTFKEVYRLVQTDDGIVDPNNSIPTTLFDKLDALEDQINEIKELLIDDDESYSFDAESVEFNKAEDARFGSDIKQGNASRTKPKKPVGSNVTTRGRSKK